MVNHDFFSYSCPIFKDKMPVDYIAGYCVTLQVDTKGNPEKVISNVSTDGGATSTNLEFKLVGHSGQREYGRLNTFWIINQQLGLSYPII